MGARWVGARSGIEPSARTVGRGLTAVEVLAALNRLPRDRPFRICGFRRAPEGPVVRARELRVKAHGCGLPSKPPVWIGAAREHAANSRGLEGSNGGGDEAEVIRVERRQDDEHCHARPGPCHKSAGKHGCHLLNRSLPAAS